MKSKKTVCDRCYDEIEGEDATEHTEAKIAWRGSVTEPKNKDGSPRPGLEREIDLCDECGVALAGFLGMTEDDEEADDEDDFDLEDEDE